MSINGLQTMRIFLRMSHKTIALNLIRSGNKSNRFSMSKTNGISSLPQNQVGFSNCVTKKSAEKAENNPQGELCRGLDPSYEANFPPLSANTQSKRRTKSELYRNPKQNEQPVQECKPESKLEQIPNEQILMSSLHEDEATFKPNSSKQPDNYGPRKNVKQSRRYSPPNNQPFDICFRERWNRMDIDSSLTFDNDLNSIDFNYSSEGNAKILMPGMVLLKRYIPISLQVNIALRCRKYGLSKGGFYQPGYEDGAKFRLRMMCFGHDWDPQTRKYSKRRNYDDSEPPEIPHDFSLLVGKALNDSLEIIKQQSRSDCVEHILPIMIPDICIANFYPTTGRLGLHQDRDESKKSISRGLPVVSFSIGDSAEFLYGEKRDVDKAENVLLESGDVLIFGGSSRLIFHGVSSILSKTAPKELVEQAKLCPGRLNLTFRQY